MGSYLDKVKKNKDKNSVNPPGVGALQDKYVNPEMSETIPESLDELETQIGKLNGKVWECAYHIGKRLIVVRDSYLKELGYTSVTEYGLEKFGFTSDVVSRFIFLANNFGIAVVRQFGSKLRLLQGLEEDDRINMLTWMEKENPTFAEIQEKLKPEKKSAGRPKQDINISKSKITIDLKKIGLHIEKDKQPDFLKALETLIKEYGVNGKK